MSLVHGVRYNPSPMLSLVRNAVTLRRPSSGELRSCAGALLCLVLLLGPLSGLVGHDHAVSERSAASCVAEHHAGQEEGHSEAPHLRAGFDHEHDCDACQHHRVRDGEPLRTGSAVSPPRLSLRGVASTDTVRRAFAWQWQARGPPVSDPNRIS